MISIFENYVTDHCLCETFNERKTEIMGLTHYRVEDDPVLSLLLKREVRSSRGETPLSSILY